MSKGTYGGKIVNRKRMTRLWFGMVVLFLLWPASTVFAAEPVLNYDGGQIFVGEDVTLEPGEVFDGDLGVLDGDLTMAEDSTVNGDVFVVDGNADAAGRVNGDLAIIGGKLSLHESSWVTGDVFGMSSELDVAGHVGGALSSLFGGMELRSTAVVKGDLLATPGEFRRDEGARVEGDEVHEFSLPDLPLLGQRLQAVNPSPEGPGTRPGLFGQRVGRFVGRAMTASFLGLVFIAACAVIVFVWPRATRQVAECISVMPAQSFGLGLLTYLIAAGLEALAAVLMILVILVGTALIATGILFPIGLLLILLSLLILLPVPLVLVAAMVFGWVGLAVRIGEIVLKALRVKKPTPLGTTVVGLLITVAVAALLWIIKPGCCAWPYVILLTSVGLGAVIHTRFGKQSCRVTKPAVEPEVLPLDAMDEELGLPDGPGEPSP
jgi:hypothetical protein